MAKRFLNGFTSWQETHFLVVSAIASELSKDKFESKLIEERFDEQGTVGMFELAEELTDEFEKINKGKNWDGEWFDEIEKFIQEKLF